MEIKLFTSSADILWQHIMEQMVFKINSPYSFQKLQQYLSQVHDYPDLLVMGAGIWSMIGKPDQAKSLQEYREGLRILAAVSYTTIPVC